MNFKPALLALAAAAAVAGPAQAAIFTYTGDTTAGPTFTRPLEDLSGLSAVGVGVRYSVFSFTVSAPGDYTFLTTGEFDTFAVLYQASFNPAAALTNALIANDDLVAPPFTTSGFAETLATGTLYHYVVTGFAPTDFGGYSTTIGGPGVVTQVPEVQTYLMMALGLGALGLARRRRLAAAA